MELAVHLDAAKLDDLVVNSIVPIDVALRANRTFHVERKKKKGAAQKNQPAELTTTNSKPKAARLDVQVSLTDSVLGAL